MDRVKLKLLNTICGILVSVTNKVLVKRNYLLLAHPKKPGRNFNLKGAQE